MEDLLALRNLYRFLQTNDTKHLDDKARLVLKDLLDSATENILSQSHAMINAGAVQSGVAKINNSKLSVSQLNALKPQLTGIQTPNTESIDSAYINEDEFCHRNVSRPVETQSNYEISISPSRLENRTQKRCRVCQQCIIKPEPRNNNYSNKGDNKCGYQSLSGIDQLHSTRRTSEENGIRVRADLIKQVNDSIRRIDYGILSLQIDSGNAIHTRCSTSSAVASDDHLPSPDKRSKQEANNGFKTNQTGQQKLQALNRTNSLMDEDMESLASAATRFTNVKDMVARIESMNQTSEPHHGSGLQRHDHIAKKSESLMKAKPSMPQKQFGGSTTKGNLARQRMFVGPTLLNYESDRKTSRASAQSKRGKMVFQHENISSSTSPSRGSSNSHQSSIFSSSIEPSATSESGDVASSNKSSRSFDENNSEEESERSISSTSPSYYSTNEDSPPRRFDKRRMYNRSLSSRSEMRRGPAGRLRRLKNKLGLIFHHHHHHHHHHHKYSDSTDYATTSKSMWKNLHKMVFHNKEDNKKSHMHVKKEPKSSQALVNRNKKNSDQMGQFHSLVEGLARHVRHKSKKTKADHVKNKKGLVRKKQTPKNRAKVKLGFKSRKSTQPKALKR